MSFVNSLVWLSDIPTIRLDLPHFLPLAMGEECVTVEEVKALADAIRDEVGKAVVGQEATVEMMLVALFAGGHILLEGPPGTAKTLIAHSFAHAVGLKFGRIQFTPDLMPGDIIGANLFNFQTSTFSLTS
eukprot:gene10734-14398_t